MAAPPRARDAGSLALARQARLAGLVMAGAFTIWVAGNLAGGALGLPGTLAFLLDLAALAAFIWALVVTFRLRRRRRGERG